ncbi:MAG: hypothetical protein MJE77_27765 [Proteobacteria bacterium]|nr:hypothetical protein [Pseudomonadota bacterium]
MPDDSAITDYLRDAARTRRRKQRVAAGVLTTGAIASGALGMQMSDIGHAVGFAVLALALLAGAVIVAVSNKS